MEDKLNNGNFLTTRLNVQLHVLTSVSQWFTPNRSAFLWVLSPERRVEHVGALTLWSSAALWLCFSLTSVKYDLLMSVADRREYHSC